MKEVTLSSRHSARTMTSVHRYNNKSVVLLSNVFCGQFPAVDFVTSHKHLVSCQTGHLQHASCINDQIEGSEVATASDCF